MLFLFLMPALLCNGFLEKIYLNLIIADPQLPDCENWELISNLHSSGLYGNIPVVVLSNLSEEEMIVKATEYTNVVRSFSQPFNPLELLDVVEDMVLAKSLKCIIDTRIILKPTFMEIQVR